MRFGAALILTAWYGSWWEAVAVRPPSQLRIIGGQWRGRRLRFNGPPDLRPTPDRVRETLFNWLQPWLQGASCLDLFAGSGALGFEALSRGAGEAWMVEPDAAAVASLKENRRLLGAERLVIRRDSAQRFLTNETSRQFDIVFLDPPFSMREGEYVFQLLEDRGWLRERALIYVESPARSPRVPPANWSELRRRQAGHVDYALYLRRDMV